MTYPDQFKFKHRNTSVTYCMQKVNYDGEYAWLCTHEADGYASGNPDTFARYYEEDITAKLNREFWTMIYPEPELVFPFTFNSVTGTIPCRAEKLLNGKIGISWGGNYTNRYTEDEIRQQIKSGEWIVTSVGEQPMTDTERLVSTLKSKPSAEAKQFYESVTPLKIEVDSNDIKETTNNLNLLAQAAENVNIALESMQALLREIGQGGMNITGKVETDYKVQYKYLDEFQ